MNLRRALLLVAGVFVATVAGVLIGRSLLHGSLQPSAELHELLHHGLNLDASQQARLNELEGRFATTRKTVELRLRADNAGLAAAIEAEHGDGPRVHAAVDRTHRDMGDLQKATLAHVFAMRQMLRPDQAVKFDRAVTKAPDCRYTVTTDLSALSDGELASLSVGGRQTAFAELVSRHRQPIYRLIIGNVGDPEEALDLVQETFIAAYRALRRYDDARPMRSWLSTIAINKCRDWSRRRRVRRLLGLSPTAESDLRHIPENKPLPDAQAGDRQDLRRLALAVAELPPPLREPLVLHAIERASQAETASILGVSEKAVETRVRRARAKLAERLRQG